jgi:hypothetical protein
MICQILLFVLKLLTSAPPGPLPHPPPYEKSKLSITQTPPARPLVQTSTSRRSTARIANRKIQTLRQADLLVRDRKRSRSKVLFVGESPRIFQTGNGLRSAGIQGTSAIALDQLQTGARNSGRCLQHKSRAAIPSRRALVAPCRRLFARQRSPCLAFL